MPRCIQAGPGISCYAGPWFLPVGGHNHRNDCSHYRFMGWPT